MSPADGETAGPKPPYRTSVHAEGNHRVIFQKSALDRTGKIGGKALDFLPGDKTGHVHGMDPCVGSNGGYSGLFRVKTPPDPGIVSVCRIGKKSSGKFRKNHPDFSQFTPQNCSTHLPHQGITAVTEVHCIDPLLFLRGLDQGFCVLKPRGQRFFTEHMKSFIEKGF